MNTCTSDAAELPPEVSAWLLETHQSLAQAIAQAQSESQVTLDGELTLPVENLPETTRQFLWHGMQQHYPALAALLREPAVGRLRAVFGAQLHLRLTDLLIVIRRCYRAEHGDAILGRTGARRQALEHRRARR